MSSLNQDTTIDAEFKNLFMMRLLFEEAPVSVDLETVKKALIEKFGDITAIGDTNTTSNNEALQLFAIKKYTIQFTEGSMPAQVVLSNATEFDESSIDAISRTQFWDIENASEILSKCLYQINIFDMMSSRLDYKERCEMLMDWLEVVVNLYPSCKAVWIESAGKLILPEAIRNDPISREDRFLYYGMNIRFFKVEDTEDMVIDTLGLYAIGLPDIQYHFKGIDPSKVVEHAFTLAHYTYMENVPVKSGETVAGLQNDDGSKWWCQYEESLIQPMREVLDVCAGEYASGKRE